jgi:hypothetical protein
LAEFVKRILIYLLGPKHLPGFVFSGSTRSRRLRVPDFLRRNPIIFRKPGCPRQQWIEKLLTVDFMLETASVEKADLIERLVLSGESLTGANMTDLQQFVNLKYLDVGDNNLPMAQLTPLTGLKELHLHCNGIRTLQLSQGMFPELKILGLGYNEICPDSIQELSKITKLEELDLTFNSITDLPRDMTTFRSLRKLSLRKNLIGADHIWLALCTIPNLQVG